MNRMKTRNGFTLMIALALAVVLGVNAYLFSDDAGTPSGNPPFSPGDLAALSERNVSAVPQPHGWDGPACSRAASPFGAANDCKGAQTPEAAADQELIVLEKPIRPEDIELTLGQVEQGSVSALSSYVSLRAKCFEEGFEIQGVNCFSANKLKQLDSKFLLHTEQQSAAGNADAQLALVNWWRLRAYQLLDTELVASKIDLDESNEKLVSRMKGHPEFVAAMSKSREAYQQLAINNPGKLAGTDYLREYTRFGL